jgi:hypothetical protein
MTSWPPAASQAPSPPFEELQLYHQTASGARNNTPAPQTPATTSDDVAANGQPNDNTTSRRSQQSPAPPASQPLRRSTSLATRQCAGPHNKPAPSFSRSIEVSGPGRNTKTTLGVRQPKSNKFSFGPAQPQNSALARPHPRRSVRFAAAPQQAVLKTRTVAAKPHQPVGTCKATTAEKGAERSYSESTQWIGQSEQVLQKGGKSA